MAMDLLDSNIELARERLKRIFRFLQALDQHRNPAKIRIDEQFWSLWLGRLPEHEAIGFEYPIDISEADAEATGEGGPEDGSSESGNGSSVILRVSRPRLTKCPRPPSDHVEWIGGDWENPSAEVEIV